MAQLKETYHNIADHQDVVNVIALNAVLVLFQPIFKCHATMHKTSRHGPSDAENHLCPSRQTAILVVF